MRKIKYLVIAFAMMIVLSGCGRKSLTCTLDEKDDTLNTYQEMKMEFKKKQIKTLEMNFKFEATNEEIKNNWQLFSKTLDESYSEYKSGKGINVTTNSDSNKYVYSISIKVDLDKATKDELQKMELGDILDSNDSIDKVKADMEENGYTCK